MLTKQKTVLRAVASVLCFTFLAGELYAAPMQSLSKALPAQQIFQNPEAFEAPGNFSTLTEIHPGSKNVFIIHIQDAHSNFSGQDNLANTLDVLMKKYGVSLVLSEGGQGDCSLTALKSIASPEVWKRVARSFLINGKIQGEEYLNLISDQPMKIIGIEDPELYEKSVASYAKLAEQRDKALAYLRNMRLSLDKLKTKLYPEALLQYEKARRSDPGIERSFGEFLKLAASESMDFSEFSEVTKLAKLTEKEKNINFELASLEEAVLVEEIDTPLQSSEEMSGGKIAHFTHLQNTLNIANQKGIDTARFLNLMAYRDYLREFSLIDFDDLMEQFQKAEDKLYASVIAKSAASGNDALILRSIDRFMRLLQAAHEIRMTADQYALFKKNEPDFSTADSQAFLNRKLAEQGFFDDVITYQPALEQGRKAMDAFYESVSERDMAFMRHTEQSLENEKQKIAILISGGYHTPHLKKLFQEKGYGYAVITPIVQSQTNQRKYESLLLASKSGGKKMIHRIEGQSGHEVSLAALDDDLAKLVKKKKDQVRVELVASNPSGARLAELVQAAEPASTEAKVKEQVNLIMTRRQFFGAAGAVAGSLILPRKSDAGAVAPKEQAQKIETDVFLTKQQKVLRDRLRGYFTDELAEKYEKEFDLKKYRAWLEKNKGTFFADVDVKTLEPFAVDMRAMEDLPLGGAEGFRFKSSGELRLRDPNSTRMTDPTLYTADRRLAELERKVDQVWQELSRNGQINKLPKYVLSQTDGPGVAKRPEALQKALYLMSIYDAERFKFLQDNNIQINEDPSTESLGYVVGSEGRGEWGVPGVYYSRLTKESSRAGIDRSIILAATLIHETEHARTFPRTMGDWAASVFGSVRDVRYLLKDVTYREYPAFVAEAQFYKNFHILLNSNTVLSAYSHGIELTRGLTAWALAIGIPAYILWKVIDGRNKNSGNYRPPSSGARLSEVWPSDDQLMKHFKNSRVELEEMEFSGYEVSRFIETRFFKVGNVGNASQAYQKSSSQQIPVIKEQLQELIRRKNDSGDKNLVVNVLGLGREPRELVQNLEMVFESLTTVVGPEKAKEWKLAFVVSDLFNEPLQNAEKRFSKELTQEKYQGAHITFTAVKANFLIKEEVAAISNAADTKADVIFHRNVSNLNNDVSRGMYDVEQRGLFQNIILNAYVQTSNIFALLASPDSLYITEMPAGRRKKEGASIPGTETVGPLELPLVGRVGTGIYRVNSIQPMASISLKDFLVQVTSGRPQGARLTGEKTAVSSQQSVAREEQNNPLIPDYNLQATEKGARLSKQQVYFSYGGVRFPLGVEFANARVVIKILKSNNWEAFVNEQKVGLYNAASGVFTPVTPLIGEVRKADDKGRFSYEGERFSLGVEFSNARVVIKILEAKNWDAFVNEQKVGSYNAASGLFTFLVEEIQKADDKGRFSYKGERFPLSTEFKNARVVIKNLESKNWEAFVDGQKVGSYNAASGLFKSLVEKVRIGDDRGRFSYAGERVPLGVAHANKRAIVKPRSLPDGTEVADFFDKDTGEKIGTIFPAPANAMATDKTNFIFVDADNFIYRGTFDFIPQLYGEIYWRAKNGIGVNEQITARTEDLQEGIDFFHRTTGMPEADHFPALIAELMEKGITPVNTAEEYLGLFKDLFQQKFKSHVQMVPGAREFLDTLVSKREQGFDIRIYLLSSSSQFALDLITKYLGIRSYFTDIIAPPLEIGKTFSKSQKILEIAGSVDADKRFVAMGGDSPKDVMAAKEASAQGVQTFSFATATGLDSKEILKNSAPDLLTENLDDGDGILNAFTQGSGARLAEQQPNVQMFSAQPILAETAAPNAFSERVRGGMRASVNTLDARLSETSGVPYSLVLDGARLSSESFTSADVADQQTKILLAQLYLERSKNIIGKTFHFLFDTLKRNAAIKFVEEQGVVYAELLGGFESSGKRIDLSGSLKAAAILKLEGRTEPKAVTQEAYELVQPITQSGSIYRLGLKVLAQIKTNNPVVLMMTLDPQISENEKLLIQQIKDAVRSQLHDVYFIFNDPNGVVDEKMSDSDFPSEAQKVRIDEANTETIQAAVASQARLLPIQGADRDEKEVGVLPLAGVFVAGVLLGRTDSISGNDLAVQFLSRLTGTKFGQEYFTLLIKPNVAKASVYQEISIKRIARIAVDKILQFTQLALKAIGSAA